MNLKRNVYFVVLLIVHASTSCVLFNEAALGGWAISADLLKYILTIVEPGEAVLEFGSGSGTGELAKFYSVYSVENDQKWLDKYDSTYFFAPIKNYGNYRWYDIDSLTNIPSDYKLILIDGPVGTIGRYGFFYHLDLFNINVPMIFDDVQRNAELKLLKDVAAALNRSFKIHICSDGKKFGVILPDNNKE